MIFLDRRTFLAGLGAAAALALAPSFGFAQAAQPEGLLVPGPLGDKVLGAENAPVTIVEYASMTCPHCGRFHRDTFPELKRKYIDTGKVRFVFRDFPLDAAAFAVAMVAHCAPADRYFDVVDIYLERQESWARSENVYNAILDLAKQVGFTQQSFEACLSNQALFENLNAVKERGVSLGVDATPTFFINGEKQAGALTIADLDERIEALL